MRRYFNTEGTCNPKRHYMVDIRERLAIIKNRYIERGSYFIINRGRQYGKTTTLRLLAEYLKPEYIVVYLDFQEIGTEEYQTGASFSVAFAEMFARTFRRQQVEGGEELLKPLLDFTKKKEQALLREMFTLLSDLCAASPKEIVLVIDEVDSAANNQVFLDFLAMLRRYYLDRENLPAFLSVVLAGVYDIKNLKLKIRPEKEHQYNSPWNIAAKYNIYMGFSAGQIAEMLQEYEEDNQAGMDVDTVSEEIYQYTSGYPYLVSAICKLLDEEIFQNGGKSPWSKAGVTEAVKTLLGENIPLFESLTRQLDEHPDLKLLLQSILFQGEMVSYNRDNHVIIWLRCLVILKRVMGQYRWRTGYLRCVCTICFFPKKN